jgi:hypothetical protein
MSQLDDGVRVRHMLDAAFIVATSACWRETELALTEDVSLDLRSVLLTGVALPSAASPGTRSEPPGNATEPENYVELGDGLWLSLTSAYR